MNNINFYKIYGLIIKSEIPLYTAVLIDDVPESYDVYIRKGISNKVSSENTKSIRMFNFSPDYVSFNIDNVASYEIIDGNEIYVNPCSNNDLEEIRKFTLGSALGLLLFQRNIIAIHGGAISINNNGIIVSGSIGAGKTTTVSTLVNKGHGFLTDDVSSVTKDLTNTYSVNSCIPYQKLCETTVEMLGHNKEDLIKIDKTKNKYFSPELKNFINEPVKLKALFYLTTSGHEEVNYKEITGAEKFRIVLSNIFREEVIPKEFFKPTFIKECISLANNISVYKVSRPKNKNSINEIVSIIEDLTLRGTA